MRVIITKKGIEFVNDLDDMNKYNPLNIHSIKKNFNPILKRNMSLNSNKKRYLNTLTTSKEAKSKNNLSINNDFDIDNISKNQLKNIKRIQLSTTKISFPKDFAHLYDDNDTSSTIIDSTFNLPSLTNSMSQNGVNLNFSSSKLFSLQEIIPVNQINKMKNQMLKEKKMKDKLSKINEYNFRSIYFPKTEFESLDELLSYPKINSDKRGLIKYLNESQNTQPIILKNLIHSNSTKLNKMNKMSQVLFLNKDKEKQLNLNIKKKIKNELIHEVDEFKQNIDLMKTKIDVFKETMDKYNKRIDFKENIKVIHRDIKKNIWTRYNFKRFNKKLEDKSFRQKKLKLNFSNFEKKILNNNEEKEKNKKEEFLFKKENLEEEKKME